MDIFGRATKESISPLWTVFNPIGTVLPKLREALYVKIDALGKKAVIPKYLARQEKEDLLVKMVAKTVYAGPKCNAGMSPVQLRSFLTQAYLDPHPNRLCVGNGEKILDISSGKDNGHISSSVIGHFSSLIDNLSAEDVFKHNTVLQKVGTLIANQTRALIL